MKAWEAFALAAVLSAPAVAKENDCYVRVYDAEHLAKNPQQIVRRIQLERMADAGVPVYFSIRIHLKNDKRPWDAGGPCKAEGTAFRCELDGDSGHVRLSPDGEDMRLDVIDYMGFEADAKNGDLDRKSFSDPAHKTFIAPKAKPADCK
jgi:hypothetical protein